MTDDVKNALLMRYSNEILELVDNRDEFSRGDLQGAVEAIVLTLLNGNHSAALKTILSKAA